MLKKKIMSMEAESPFTDFDFSDVYICGIIVIAIKSPAIYPITSASNIKQVARLKYINPLKVRTYVSDHARCRFGIRASARAEI